MNIVILGSAYPLRGGGLATFNERLARAFQQAGDDVTIYTFSLQYPGFLFPGKNTIFNRASSDRSQNKSLYQLNVSFKLDTSWKRVKKFKA
jgi:hypothetical protein